MYIFWRLQSHQSKMGSAEEVYCNITGMFPYHSFHQKQMLKTHHEHNGIASKNPKSRVVYGILFEVIQFF